MASNPTPQVSELIKFIRERHAIYERRKSGAPKPWTSDRILQQYRFCNVYRELDVVTVWIADNWREPNRDDPDLWFAMLVARYINEPRTLHQLQYPVPWSSKRWLTAVKILQDHGKNIFNAAYIIPPTAGTSVGGTTVGGPKHAALDRFFTYFWDNRKKFRPIAGHSLANYADKLCTVPGMGRFFAGQIIADLKYVGVLQKAPDWWSFAVSGPGSRRGLNRVLDRGVDKPWKEADWFYQLNNLRKVVNSDIKGKMPQLHGQDMQNCLCEFDKYMRAKLGEGRPKQKFDGR